MAKDNETKPTIEFAPGCFDNFDGTQEELDELIAEITSMVEDGSILENSIELDLDSLMPEELALIEQIDKDGYFDPLNDTRKRKLH